MSPRSGEADPLLWEILREAERAIDHQLTVLADLDERTGEMVKLGVATLGGGLVALAFLVDRAGVPESGSVRAAVVVCIVLNLMALMFFLDVYVGVFRRHQRQAGADPQWLAERANDPTWRIDQHFLEVVAGHGTYFRENARLMATSAKSRRAGIVLLVAAVIGYMGVALYLL